MTRIDAIHIFLMVIYRLVHPKATFRWAVNRLVFFVKSFQSLSTNRKIIRGFAHKFIF